MIRWTPISGTAVLTCAVLATVAFGQSKPSEGGGSTYALTIYSSAQPGAIPPELYKPNIGQGIMPEANIPGYAFVKQEQEMTLEKGRGTVRFTDVAAQIDPTTVSFASLTDTATRVLEQNFQFDLVSADKLMERYLDHPITVEQNTGDKVQSFTGTLLSTTGGVILKGEDGTVQVVNGYANVRFPQLPGGLITRPTLVWEVFTDQPGPHRTRVTYQTNAMTWWADYNVIFSEGADANKGELDFGAWVSIINQSGAGYPDAKLKLIAGDVQRAPQPQRLYPAAKMRAMAAEADMAGAGFEEKAFFEYHLYTLGRPTTLPNNSTKQIELFPTIHKVPVEKVLVYYGAPSQFRFYGAALTDRNLGTESNKKVDIYLKLKNEKDIGMGMPLPAGRVRVSKMDPADQTLEFIGEDVIQHTAKDEEILIKLGSAFDVVGERKQTDFQIDTARRRLEESYEIKVRNHKEQPVKVLIKENLFRWSTWKITDKTHDFEKVDARTIHFPITVNPDGEVTVRYTVLYTW